MRTQVAVGVIYNKTMEKVLLALRPDNVAHGGLWEFPGGKIKPGENIDQALARELNEELGLRVLTSSPLISIDHDYPGIPVTLHVRAVTNWDGTASGMEGQAIEWVSLYELSGKKFPQANHAIVTAARLPALFLITPDLPVYDPDFLHDLDRILSAGVRLLQFRCKETDVRGNDEIIRKISDICNLYKCMFIVNGAPGDAIKYQCHGIHLTSQLLHSLDNRPLPRDLWVSASCHNQEELKHACKIGLDFAVLSPVQSTNSHPGSEPMGWEAFAGMARSSTIPVYALGGMKSGDICKARINGGQGIAVISEVWDARDKIKVVKRILEETA